MYRAICRKSGQVVAIKHICGFHQHEYNSIKLVREIQIMKILQNIQSGYNRSCFVPEVYDIIVPPEEQSVESLQNMFIVMELEVSDLR